MVCKPKTTTKLRVFVSVKYIVNIIINFIKLLSQNGLRLWSNLIRSIATIFKSSVFVVNIMFDTKIRY